MSDFRTVFENYGGDYDLTMERFLGDESMYVMFLEKLLQDDNKEKLKAALEAGDLNAAFEAAHTLKGVAANMGLTPLYDAVCKLVEPLRAKESRTDYLSLYGAVEEAFANVMVLQGKLCEK